MLLLLGIGACNRKNNQDIEMNKEVSEPAVKVDTGHADVNGISMYYEVYGTKGDTLVLIHGGGSTIQTSFARIIPLLAEKYVVVAMDLQAHGRTSDRPAPESFEQDADDVAVLLKVLNISKAHIAGFSNGGSTAIQVALRHPQVVDKLIVCSAAYKLEGLMDGFSDMMKGATLDNMPQALKDGFMKVNPDKAKLQNMFNKDRDRMLNFKDMSDADLKAIKAQTLLIASDMDVVKPEHVVKMKQLIPNASLCILPGLHGEYLGEASVYKQGTLYYAATVVISEFLAEHNTAD